MSDQDLRQALDHTKMGAAVLGVCIARVLSRTTGATLQDFAEEADRMHKHLCGCERPEWGEILMHFALAVGRPDWFPLFHPKD
jgi:hypothetical protein